MLGLLLGATAMPGRAAPFDGAFLAGVNLAGAEFGARTLPGVPGTDYIYPGPAALDRVAASGMNAIRLPFLWERLQPHPFGPLAAGELARIAAVVEAAEARHLAVVLDVHNYARHRGRVLGGPELPAGALADLWGRLAVPFAGRHRVLFGLMNEPMRMETDDWLDAANRAIHAIREAGAGNLVLVPGNGWTGAHSWSSDHYGTPNATVMVGVVDPLDRYAYEMHQYLDGDSSGRSADCVDAETAVRRVAGATRWLRERGRTAFLGEIGAGPSARCLESLDAVLAHLSRHRDAWMGWAYWAAGPWWGDYPFSIEPGRDGRLPPQAAVLARHAASARREPQSAARGPEAGP